VTSAGGIDSVPDGPIAAFGLAHAVAKVLTATHGGLTLDESAQVEDENLRRDERAAVGSLDLPQALFATQLSGFAYHSSAAGHKEALEQCDAAGEACQLGTADDASAKLQSDLAAVGFELVRELLGAGDEYAYIAHNATSVVIVFRGSCTLKNAMTDIDYRDDDGTAVRSFAASSGLPLPEGMHLHRGFTEAYMALRQDLVHALAEIPPLPEDRSILVTGHSMGGAMAMLAALELSQPGQGWSRVQACTIAAPRLGDARFANLYTRTLSGDHVALQAPCDAIPHLPFAAWGFRHPHGIVHLDDGKVEGGAHGIVQSDDGRAEGGQAESKARLPDEEGRETAEVQTVIASRRSSDHGDTVDVLRPKEGVVQNWAQSHDLSEYLDRLLTLSRQSRRVSTPAAS